MSMEDFVSDVAAGLLEILFVNCLDSFAFVGLSEGKVLICFVKSLASDALEVNGVAH